MLVFAATEIFLSYTMVATKYFAITRWLHLNYSSVAYWF
jgi:hypothetical protein